VRTQLPDHLEQGRIHGNRTWGAYGAWQVQGPCGEKLRIIASAADPDDTESEGWEHVSVSTARRIPNWLEMCFVKDLFWLPEEWVVQFHPAKSEYVNNHPFVLHLWRYKFGFPTPPSILVGIKGRGLLTQAEADEISKTLWRKWRK
jgi:hypothetical protein